MTQVQCQRCNLGMQGRHAPTCTPERRFDQRFSKQPNGCWEWTAGRNEWNYGVFPIRGRNVYAHRFAYTRWVGPIPEGQKVLHRCDNPPCVNPAHLFLGTQQANVDDMYAKGRAVPNQFTSKSHCNRGHPYSGKNLYIYPGGRHRGCRICMAAFQRQYRQQRGAAR
jgi:hypothetical protein